MARKDQKYDPLSVIPSAAVIRDRIRELKDEARRLGILLRTAEEIERDRRSVVDPAQSPSLPKGEQRDK